MVSFVAVATSRLPLFDRRDAPIQKTTCGNADRYPRTFVINARLISISSDKAVAASIFFCFFMAKKKKSFIFAVN